METKCCSKCSQEKPLIEFSKCKRHSTGYASSCKLCAKKYYTENRERILLQKKEYYVENKEQISSYKLQYNENNAERKQAYNKIYYIENRGCILKQVAEYRLNHKKETSTNKARYYVENKKQISKKHSETYYKNIDYYKLKSKEYRESVNGRTVRKAAGINRRVKLGNKVIPKILNKLKEESGGICPYCGREIIAGHVDHVIPVVKGGTNDENNLLYVCSTCNLRKGSKDLDIFLLKLSKEVYIDLHY